MSCPAEIGRSFVPHRFLCHHRDDLAGCGGGGGGQQEPNLVVGLPDVEADKKLMRNMLKIA